MASTFSQTLRLELIGEGEQSGLWGQTTNTNLGTLLEQAITGVVNITMADANYTLTNFNGVSDEARNAVLVVGGTNAAVRDIIAPLVEKLYVVKNSTVGGYAVNIRGSSGSSVSVPNGGTVWVYCDGTNFNAVGTETVGNFEVNGNLTVTGNTNAANATYTGNVAALNFSTTGNVSATGNATATNFIGAGLTLTSINASNISAGTIANARTTADSANGASTIVARDANGSFTANAITTTSISGNGVALTAINASNITSGTIANARTTAASANGASTIVARDADGSFAANVVSATNVSATNVAYTGTLTGGTGVVNIGSGQVYKDASGNVGIGTTTPSSQLETNFNFSGKANLSAVTLGGGDSGIGFTGIKVAYKDATDLTNATSFPLQVFTNNAAQLTVTGTGNVGIGTSSPSGKLQITDTTNLLADVTANGSIVQFRKDATPTFAASIGNALPGGSVTNDMLFGTWNGSAWSERMRITSSGSVGIGTSSPISRFSVNGGTITGLNSVGAVPASFDAGELLSLHNLNSGYTLDNRVISFGASPFSSGSSLDGSSGYVRSTGRLSLIAATTEVARFNGNGSVGIGSSLISSGLTVAAGGTNGWAINTRTNVSTLYGHVVLTNPNGNVGSIQTEGNEAYYTSVSDYRLKENIAPMTGALNKVAKLKPVTYTWKATGKNAQGFIAHELQEVVPNAVIGEKDAVDKDGKPIYQGVDTSFLVATLTAAIQEQQAIINDLKARIETLENKK